MPNLAIAVSATNALRQALFDAWLQEYMIPILLSNEEVVEPEEIAPTIH